MAIGEEMTAYSHVFILHVHISSTTLVFQAGRLQDTAKPASPLGDAVIELCSSTVAAGHLNSRRLKHKPKGLSKHKGKRSGTVFCWMLALH